MLGQNQYTVPIAGVTLPSTVRKDLESPRSQSLPTNVESPANECVLSIVIPIKLTDIFLVVSSTSTYRFTQDHPVIVERWLFQGRRILRTGDTLHGVASNGEVVDRLDPPGGHDLEICLCEPVSQGYGVIGEMVLLRIIFMQVPRVEPFY